MIASKEQIRLIVMPTPTVACTVSYWSSESIGEAQGKPQSSIPGKNAEVDVVKSRGATHCCEELKRALLERLSSEQ